MRNADDDKHRRRSSSAYSAFAVFTILVAAVVLIVAMVHVAPRRGGGVPRGKLFRARHGHHAHDDDDGSSSSINDRPPPAEPVVTTTVASVTTTAALTSNGGDGGVTVVSAVQTPPPPVSDGSVKIVLLCNERTGERHGWCRAVFTYESTFGDERTVRVGPHNYVSPGPVLDAGQRETFAPGLHIGGASILWDCSGQAAVRWTLRDSATHVNVVSVVSTALECPALG